LAYARSHLLTFSTICGDSLRRANQTQDETPSLRTEQSPTNNPNESIFSSKGNGYLRDVASVIDPPDLEAWRERLFHIDDMIVMSEEEYGLLPLFRDSESLCWLCWCHNDYDLTPVLIQVPNLLSARRQHLLAPLHTAIQAQAPRVPLLGLPPKGSTPGHPEIRRPKQEEAQANSPTAGPLRRQDQNHRALPWYYTDCRFRARGIDRYVVDS